jgi:hypothetical protein
MAAPTGTKLQIPQIERIREVDTHVADAIQGIADYVNTNTTPIAGNAVTPANKQTASLQAKIIPLNPLR